MRITWPIEDPRMGKLQLIDEALADYRRVVEDMGYVPVGLPRDWDIETRRLRPHRNERNYLVCVVEVMPLAGEEAA